MMLSLVWLVSQVVGETTPKSVATAINHHRKVVCNIVNVSSTALIHLSSCAYRNDNTLHYAYIYNHIPSCCPIGTSKLSTSNVSLGLVTLSLL